MTMIDAERPDTKVEVILGVDTHLDFHVAVAIDHLGRRLGESSAPTTPKGYEKLLIWAEDFGSVRCAGVEGTSSYGAGLARHLRARGIEVLEVERPKHRRRSSRRNVQKSDPSDAESAARAVLSGEASGVPKSADGRVEMIRTLRAARRSAIKARTQAANQLQIVRVTAPEELLNGLRGLSTKELVSVAARFRIGDDPRNVPTATKFARRSVARRYEILSEEIAGLDTHLDRLVARAAPELISLPGIGTENPAARIVRTMPGMGVVFTAEFVAEVGNLGRFASADALAAAAGVAPEGERDAATRSSSASCTARPSVAFPTTSVARPSTEGSGRRARGTTRR